MFVNDNSALHCTGRRNKFRDTDIGHTNKLALVLWRCLSVSIV